MTCDGCGALAILAKGKARLCVDCHDVLGDWHGGARRSACDCGKPAVLTAPAQVGWGWCVPCALDQARAWSAFLVRAEAEGKLGGAV